VGAAPAPAPEMLVLNDGLAADPDALHRRDGIALLLGTVFSSIDHGGRYAYGGQPQIAQWNLARLAESLLPLVDRGDQQAAVGALMPVLEAFPDRFLAAWRDGMHAKLGLPAGPAEDESIVDCLLTLLREDEVDWTSAFRALARVARGDADALAAVVPTPASRLRRTRALARGRRRIPSGEK
jgi:uncharacterized protein YdiU (UPF0061 family)